MSGVKSGADMSAADAPSAADDTYAVDEEWGEIDNLMEGLVMEVPTIAATKPPSADTLLGWLTQFSLQSYHDVLVEGGFDNLNFLGEGNMTETDLRHIGIRSQDDCSTLVAVASMLPESQAIQEPESVAELLENLNLQEYEGAFEENDVGTLKKMCALWDNDFRALGITKLGHRRRLMSAIRELHLLNPMLHGDVKLPEMSDDELALRMRKLSMTRLIELSRESLEPTMPETDVHRDFTGVQPSMRRRPLPEPAPRVKVDTNESRGVGNSTEDHNFDSSRPSTDHDLDPLNLRSPRSAQEHNVKLLHKMGIESAHLRNMGDSWKHQVTEVTKGNLHYDVAYLGTDLVKKFEGPKTTADACSKMKAMAAKMQKVPKISLWIHGSIIKFVDSKSQSVIQKDELKTVLYIAQDTKDPTVFGYVTRDPAQKKLCFCHVLRAPTKKEANEVVMTLGQAFEIAYQNHKKAKSMQKMAAFEKDLEARRSSKHSAALASGADGSATTTAGSMATAPAAAASSGGNEVGDGKEQDKGRDVPAYAKVRRVRKAVVSTGDVLSPAPSSTSGGGAVKMVATPPPIHRSPLVHKMTLKANAGDDDDDDPKWVTSSLPTPSSSSEKPPMAGSMDDGPTKSQRSKK